MVTICAARTSQLAVGRLVKSRGRYSFWKEGVIEFVSNEPGFPAWVGIRTKVRGKTQFIYGLTRREFQLLPRYRRPKREGVSLRLRFEVLRRCGFRCVYCGVSSGEAKIEIDHIVPVSDGGSSRSNNLVAACYNCNRGKRNRPIEPPNSGLAVTELAGRTVRDPEPNQLVLPLEVGCAKVADALWKNTEIE